MSMMGRDAVVDIAKKMQKSDKIESPFSQLSHHLSHDMDKVNCLILDYMKSDVPLVPQLAQYLIAAGGKRIRPLLTLAAAQLIHGASYDHNHPILLAAAVEFIHTATLLHDDVVDESTLRRGRDSANHVFGNQAAVLVGDFLFSRAFQMMVKTGSVQVLDILSQASAIIAEGEVLQLSKANDMTTTLDDYQKIITAKTAALFAAACEVGAISAGATIQKSKALYEYGHHLGIAFQIADDVLDYQGADTIGKNQGDDFKEGKLTAPVFFALEQADATQRAFWQRVLGGETPQTEDDFAQAIDYITQHDGFNKANALAVTHAQKACAALDTLKILNTELMDLLKSCALYSVNRHY
jgi:octaprenyl-diphosphate synthase